MGALKRVTITGADNQTDIRALLDLSAEFPFVEWGILVSQRSEGSFRFPNRVWMETFAARVSEREVAVSMHVCGEWVRKLLRGRLDWDELPAPIRIVADRVQINTHAQEHYSTARFMDLIAERSAKQFIVQLDGVNDHLFDACKYRHLNVTGLFDGSHGAGVLPEKWPTPHSHAHTAYFGYAGGLSPENVADELPKIEAARCGLDFWIDMQGRVRDEQERLDLGKVRRVLEICAPVVARP